MGQKNQDSKFKTWFNTKFVPSLTKIGNQRHIANLRDTFGIMLAVIIAGSLGLLMQAIVFGGAGSGKVSLLGVICKVSTSLSWDDVNSVITSNVQGYTAWFRVQEIAGGALGILNVATIGSMSIYFSFIYGYFLAKNRNFKSPILAGSMSVGLFIVLIMGEINYFMGATGLIIAIVSSICGTELFMKLSSVKKFEIKLPAGVPPNVGRSFAVLIPAIITLGSYAVVNMVFLGIAIPIGLAVGAGSYTTFATEDLNVFLQKYGNGSLSVEELTNLIISNQLFVGQEDLTNLLAQEIEKSTNVAELYTNLETLYNSLNEESQSIMSNMIAQINGTTSNLYTIDSGGKISFISTNAGDNVAYVMNIRYQIIQVDSSKFGFGAAIYKFFGSWFAGFATSDGGLALALVYVFFVSFFWFFGIHGSNLMAGIFEPIWYMISGINVALISQLTYQVAVQTGDLGILTYSFVQSYYMLGGSGCTLGLIINTLIFSKRKDLKEIAKYGAPSGLFQINEPIIFGYPVVLNPVYVVPFFAVPMVNVTVGYLFTYWGFVNYSYITVPWTTPWFLGAIISSTDWRQIIPTMIGLGVSIGLYLPFVLLDNILYMKKIKKEDYELYLQVQKYWTDPQYKFSTDRDEKIDKFNERLFELNDKKDYLNNIEDVNEKTKKQKEINLISNRILKLTTKKEKYISKAEETISKKSEKWAIIYQKRVAKQNREQKT